MSAVPQPLTDLAVGQNATVVEIQLPPDTRARVLELGLLAGTPIQIVRFAPMGDPIEILVRGYHLTLHRHEADHILVRLTS